MRFYNRSLFAKVVSGVQSNTLYSTTLRTAKNKNIIKNPHKNFVSNNYPHNNFMHFDYAYKNFAHKYLKNVLDCCIS